MIAVELALTLLYALPNGTAYTGSGALADTIAGQPAARVDAGVRLLGEHLYVGAMVQGGTLVASTCPDGSSCTGSDLRVGVRAAFHVLPTSLVDPWVGVGFGYEALTITRTASSATLEMTMRGPELAAFDVGVDLRPVSFLRVGPVVSGSLARYTSVALNGTSTSDFETTLHGWLTFGLRGAVVF